MEHGATTPKVPTPSNFPAAPSPPIPPLGPLVGTPTGPAPVELCPASSVANSYASPATSSFTSGFNNTRSMIWNMLSLTSTPGWMFWIPDGGVAGP